MSGSYQHILFDLGEGVATLTLNRPDRLNSFTDAMHGEVREALRCTTKEAIYAAEKRARTRSSISSATSSASSAALATTAKGWPPSWKSAHRGSAANRPDVNAAMNDPHSIRKRSPSASAAACSPRTPLRADSACSVEAMGPGYARMTMTVRPEMLNGFKICHGGFITTLADSALRFRLQQLQRAHRWRPAIVVDFIAPAREGDLLTAEAQRGHARPDAPACTTSRSPTSAARSSPCCAAAPIA